jgi:hypothetical protein
VAAVAAVQQLNGDPPVERVSLDLLQPAGLRALPFEALLRLTMVMVVMILRL